MRAILESDTKRESIIDSAVEKHLLALHAAMDLDSFWKAVHQLVSSTVPSELIGLTLQHNPISPLIAKWTLPMPAGLFITPPLKECVCAERHKKIVRITDLFSNRNSFTKSVFYRRYMAPQDCAHAVCLLFWQRSHLIGAIVVMRTAAQGDLETAEMKLLRQLHPQILTAFHRLRTLEHERAVRVNLQEFVRRLPLPTMLLRWNLKLLFQNPAARDFCAVWEKGWDQARLTNPKSPPPPEILDRCRRLKQKWAHSQRPGLPRTSFEREQVHHPKSRHLRATIGLKQLNSVVAKPHFLIECDDSRRLPGPLPTPASLPHLARLTGREQEVTRLVCNGQSNQEIADVARLSLPMVKKHLHAIFRKLEVTSRSQLMALIL